jgi:hypothetical protein
MAGMDGLLCTEEALEDEDFGMLDRFMSGDALYDDLGIGHAAQESQWSSSTRSWGGVETRRATMHPSRRRVQATVCKAMQQAERVAPDGAFHRPLAARQIRQIA